VRLNFYSPEEVSATKKLLVREFSVLINNTVLTTERRSSASRPAHDAEIDDIIQILEELDAQKALDGYVSAVSALGRLSKYAPKEINICAVADRQIHADVVLGDLKVKVDSLCDTSPPAPADNSQLGRFESVNQSILQQLEKLSAACDQLLAAPSNVQPTAVRESRDRSMNIIMFGVPEHGETSVWRKSLLDAVHHAAGRAVDTDDMFRVGRYTAGKVRPVIVKLRSSWDRRLILNNCYKLKNVRDRVFIRPHESVEDRRKRMFEQMKSRAERDVKTVSVVNEILTVDALMYFLSQRDVYCTSHHVRYQYCVFDRVI